MTTLESFRRACTIHSSLREMEPFLKAERCPHKSRSPKQVLIHIDHWRFPRFPNDSRSTAYHKFHNKFHIISLSYLSSCQSYSFFTSSLPLRFSLSPGHRGWVGRWCSAVLGSPSSGIGTRWEIWQFGAVFSRYCTSFLAFLKISCFQRWPFDICCRF